MIEQGTKKEQEERKIVAKRRFQLLPKDQGEALLCMIVAGGDARAARALEWDVPFVDVVRQYALQLILAWQPPQKK